MALLDVPARGAEALPRLGKYLLELVEHLGVPGMSVRKTVPFRDKEVMKQVLDRAGIRTPRHASVTTVAGCREAAASIGFPSIPIVLKPIAGAGSADVG